MLIIVGTADWAHDYSTCTGKHQSPIDISSASVKIVKLNELELINFDRKPQETTIENNGHTGTKFKFLYNFKARVVIRERDNKKKFPVYFTVDTKYPWKIQGGPLSSSYSFSQLHFHWSNNDSYGSEGQFVI